MGGNIGAVTRPVVTFKRSFLDSRQPELTCIPCEVDRNYPYDLLLGCILL